MSPQKGNNNQRDSRYDNWTDDQVRKAYSANPKDASLLREMKARGLYGKSKNRQGGDVRR